MRIRTLLVFLMAILSLAAVACGSQTADGEAPVVKEALSGSEAGASDFSIQVARSVGGNIESSEFSLAANLGKPTVLYFSFIG